MLQLLETDKEEFWRVHGLPAIVEGNPKEVCKLPESLCWDCGNATWGCLCSWPEEPPRGVSWEEYEEQGETLRVVVKCPLFWEE